MIKLFAMDVDGTLTDGKIHISEEGELFKSFNVKDGLGIKMLLENNIIPVIITGRKSKIVLSRAKELGINHVYQDIKEKKQFIINLCNQLNISLDEVAYIGDDLNDLEVLECVKYSYAPSDSATKILNTVKYACSKKGGDGAVREAIDDILNLKQ